MLLYILHQSVGHVSCNHASTGRQTKQAIAIHAWHYVDVHVKNSLSRRRTIVDNYIDGLGFGGSLRIIERFAYMYVVGTFFLIFQGKKSQRRGENGREGKEVRGRRVKSILFPLPYIPEQP